MIVSTEAIVLKSQKFSDSSKIIKAYSKDYGKVSLLARGAYKQKSKFGGALETFNCIYITFFKKSGKDLFLLQNAELITSMNKIVNDLEKLSIALLLSESILQTQEDGNENQELYKIIESAMQLLKGTIADTFLIFLHFIISLSNELGFSPNFSLEEPYELPICTFLISEGEFLNSFIANNGRSFKFNKETVIKINLALNGDNSIKFSKIEKRQFINFIQEYFSYHLERKFIFRSLELISD